MMLTSIHLACLSIYLHDVLIAEKDNHCDQTSDEGAPALVSKDIGQENTALPQDCSIRSDSGRHRIISANTNTKEDTKATKPNKSVVGGDFTYV